MCMCANCECKNCGLQNPERLVGEAAKNAGVLDWTQPWLCDPNCDCCDK